SDRLRAPARERGGLGKRVDRLGPRWWRRIAGHLRDCGGTAATPDARPLTVSPPGIPRRLDRDLRDRLRDVRALSVSLDLSAGHTGDNTARSWPSVSAADRVRLLRSARDPGNRSTARRVGVRVARTAARRDRPSADARPNVRLAMDGAATGLHPRRARDRPCESDPRRFGATNGGPGPVGHGFRD